MFFYIAHYVFSAQYSITYISEKELQLFLKHSTLFLCDNMQIFKMLTTLSKELKAFCWKHFY